MMRSIHLSEVAPDLALFPAHLRGENWWRLWLLRRWANGVHGYYGHPVWLCGSALRDDNPNPRDWDLRVVFPDDEFAERFGLTAAQWIAEGSSGLWSEARHVLSHECVKRSKQGMKHTHLAIDFQILPETEHIARYANSPRVRLDTCRCWLDADYSI